MNKYDPTHQERLKAALALHAILFLRDPKKELDNARVLLYFKALEEYDIEDIEIACFSLQKKLRKFPLPIDIDEACAKLVSKREARGSLPPQRPGDKPWCEDCMDSGMLFTVAPAREKRDIGPDDPSGDQLYTWAGKCSCREQNPVYKWKRQQDRAGVIRRDKSEEGWNPQRKGQLVQFRK